MSRLFPVRSTRGSISAWLCLVMFATAVDGLLAGASLDQSVKQLPARHRIGVRAFSDYSQASDLGNGILWYATLGLGGAVLTLAAGGVGLVFGVSGKQRLPLLLAGALTIGHSLTTVRAAPVNLSQRSAAGNEEALARIFNRFERWQSVRAVLQVATFFVMIWAVSSAASQASNSD